MGIEPSTHGRYNRYLYTFNNYSEAEWNLMCTVFQDIEFEVKHNNNQTSKYCFKYSCMEKEVGT